MKLQTKRALRCTLILAVTTHTLGCMHVARADLLDPYGVPDPAYPSFYAWYDAGDGVNGPGMPADGAAVTNWLDNTGNGRDLVRTDDDPNRHAAFVASAVNDLPAVRFDGNDYIWADPTDEFGTIGTPGRTYFAVARVRVLNRGYVFDSSSSAGRNALFAGQSADPLSWWIYTGSGSAVVSENVTLDAWQVHLVTMDAAASTQAHYVDGALSASGNETVADMAGLMVGSRYSLSLGLDGEIAELLVYDSVLSADDRQAIEGYLMDKYPAPDPPPWDPPEYVDVYTSGADGYPRFRIPAIIATLDGTLLAFCEARQGGDHSQNDIVLKRSTDGGITWGPLQILDDAGGDSLNDPLVVQVREGPHAGRIYVFYMRFPEGCHTSCVDVGYGPTSSHNFMVYSEDDGVTWTSPLDVTTQVRRETSNFAGSPSMGLQKRYPPHVGRLVLPMREGPVSHMKCYALYSDDGGDTWLWGDLIDDSQSSGNGTEPQMVELADGSIMLNARRRSSSEVYRKIAWSYDGGEIWTPLTDDDELISPGCMASIIRYTDPLDGYTSRILYAGPNSTSSRVNGTVHLSYDEGDTWPISKTVYPAGYAYSALVNIDDHTIGCFFERDSYAHITLARFSLEWLTDGADAFCPADLDHDDDVSFTDVLIFAADYGGPDAPGSGSGNGDLDLDGDVDLVDFARFQPHYGETCP